MKNLNGSGSPCRLGFTDAVVQDYMGYNGDGTLKTDSSGNIVGLRALLNISGRPEEDDITYAPLSCENNYMVFYASRVAAAGSTGNRAEDHKKGIFHYLLGRDRGLLKEINLQKTQTKGLAEARFEMDGYDGLQQLRVVYDLDITTYANVNVYPGTYIYVPPGGFDPSFDNYAFTTTDNKGQDRPLDLSQLGIGGYYMVIRSTNTFSAGMAETKIYAKWVNSLESDYPAAEGGVAKESNGDNPTCGAAIDARNQELSRP